LKKPAGSVRFRFYKQKIKKTEPNRTETDKKPEKKPSQTEKTEPNQKQPSQNRKKPSQNRKKPSQNRAKPVFALKKPNRTETGQFDPISVRFRYFFQKKKFDLITFFNKN